MPDLPTAGQQPRDERPAWQRTHLWQIQWVRDMLVIAVVVGVIYLGYVLSFVTVPLLLALGLAYLFEPLVGWATGRFRWLSRPGAAVAIVVLAAATILVPLGVALTFGVVQGIAFTRSVAQNVIHVSAYSGAMNAVRQTVTGEDGRPLTGAQFMERLQTDPEFKARLTSNENYEKALGEMNKIRSSGWQSVARYAAGEVESEDMQFATQWLRDNAEQILKSSVATGGNVVVSFVKSLEWLTRIGFGVFITAFFFFFVCSGYARVLSFTGGLIPERNRATVFDLVRKMDAVVAGFVRGRLLICGIQIVQYSILYWLIGLPAAVFMGILIGLLALVPFLSVIGVPIAILLMWLDPPTGWRSAWWWIMFAPAFVYFAGQAVDDYLLTPIIQGKRTDMDTPTVLFASLSGGVLAGVYGLLLAIPAAACLKILIREVFWPRFRAWGEGRAKDFLPIGPHDSTDTHR
ncbi:MAG: AI-2E family transporter [Phycisphaerales bacterium]|nr:AI-2E family transporter [Phycisphaerales bacterium]